MKEIKELAISGGGVKGIAFLGALYQLERDNRLNNLEKVAGSSIGSFLSACLVIGYKPSELIDIIFDIDLKNIKDINLKGILKNKSILKGENYKKFIRNFLEKKINPEISLLELYNKTNIELIICVSCINTREVEYINYKNNPNLDLFTLILMSSAIPGFFPPISYKNKLYIDGCILDNIPLSQLSNDAIGICQKYNKVFVENSKLNFINMFSNIIQMISMSLQKNIEKKYKNLILIDTKNISVTSFNINKDEKLTLIQCGINSVKNNLFI